MTVFGTGHFNFEVSCFQISVLLCVCVCVCFIALYYSDEYSVLVT